MACRGIFVSEPANDKAGNSHNARFCLIRSFGFTFKPGWTALLFFFMFIMQIEDSRSEDGRMDSWRHHCRASTLFKVFANVSVEAWRCLCFFKWWRHILHINNHLRVPQHEFRMSYTPSSRESFLFVWMRTPSNAANVNDLGVISARRISRRKVFVLCCLWHDFNATESSLWMDETFYRDE